MNSPRCCNTDATFVAISPSISYYYCRECKKEVANEYELSEHDIAQLSGFEPGAIEFKDSIIGVDFASEPQLPTRAGLAEAQELLAKRRGWSGPRIMTNAEREEELRNDELMNLRFFPSEGR